MGDSLVDTFEIIDVTIRYCTALDTKDWVLMGSVFTPDATASYSRPGSANALVGYGAIEQWLSNAMGRLLVSQHCVSNHVVNVRGDEAECRCYLRAQHIRAGEAGEESYMVGGNYVDRFVRTDNGWRIASREMTRTWSDKDWMATASVPSAYERAIS